MDVHFRCTLCARCCRDVRLPLTVLEARRWLADGNPVQVLCEAIPWPVEPPPDNPVAAHRRRASFAARSGALAVRIGVILTADLKGACPNLLPDLRCGIHDRRPLVCAIYPAEVNPFVEWNAAGKACPPEAWDATAPLLMRDGALVDARTRGLVAYARAANVGDVEVKRRLCHALDVHDAGLAPEGFVVHSPPRAALAAALEGAGPGAEPARAGQPARREPEWRFISDRRAALSALEAVGAQCAPAGTAGASFDYLRATAGVGDAGAAAEKQHVRPDF